MNSPSLTEGLTILLDAIIDTGESLLGSLGVEFDEAKRRAYYMDERTVKRWILGDGGVSGNCDLCVENAEAGWIDIDDVYPNSDEPPAHPHCTCGEEEKDQRYRVYV